MKLFFVNDIQNSMGVIVTAGSTINLLLSQNTTTGSEPLTQTPIVIPIDNTGSASQEIWFNDEQLPANTFYNVTIVTPNYGIVYNQNVPITGASFNLASFVPGSQGSLSAVYIPSLETNGTANANQTILNLKSGTGITLTAGSSGDVTITGAAQGVTSVGLADSTGLFTITGSPVTSTGTLTLSSFASQASNTFLAAPSEAGVSVTYIGSNGTQNIGTNPVSLSAYNQAAGHLIVVFINTYENAGNTVSSVTDTAGNTYVAVITPQGLAAAGSQYMNCYYCANCLGNATNVIQVNYAATHVAAYSWLAAYDLVGATSSPLDSASITTHAVTPATTTSPVTGAYSTATADEIIFVQFASTNGYSATTAINNSYTLDQGNIDGTGTELGSVSHKIITEIVSSETTTLTLGAAVPYGTVVVAFKLNSSSGVPTFREIVAADLPIAINSGTANQIAYYDATGTAVSGDSRLTDSGTELTYIGTTGINISSSSGYIFNNDTVMSRLSANVIGFGNGVGQSNGTIEAGEFYSPGGSVYTGGGGGVTTSSLTVLGATANFGTAGTTSGVITLVGLTSGTATITGPATAGTVTNPIVFSNAIGLGVYAAGTYSTVAGALGAGYSGAANLGIGDGTNARRIPMTLYSGYSFAATGNVTSFTSLFATPTGSTGSLTLVANQQTVGSTLHIRAVGTVTVSTATQACFFESRLKTGVLSESGISLTTAAISWEYDSYTYCSAVGAAGVATMQTTVITKFYSSTTIAANTTGAAVTTLSSTVDTTTTQLVDLLFAFGASEVGNTMTCTWAEVTLE